MTTPVDTPSTPPVQTPTLAVSYDDSRRNDDDRDRKDAPSYKAGAAALLVLAALALGLGAPRAIGEIRALEAQDVVQALLRREPVADSALAAADRSLTAARGWLGPGLHSLDSGLVALARAQAAIDPASRERFFDEAEKSTTEGLSVAPGEPGAWLRLSWLRRRRGDVPGALAALRLSWLSGSFAPSIMMSRLEFALPMRAMMDEEMNELLRRQVRLAWVAMPTAVADAARRPEFGPLVREALDGLTEEEAGVYLKLHGVTQ